jgi:hypothetical protein
MWLPREDSDSGSPPEREPEVARAAKAPADYS